MTPEHTVTVVMFALPTPARVERGIIAEVGVRLRDDLALAYRLEFDDDLDLHLEPRGGIRHRLVVPRARALALEHHEQIEMAVIETWYREVDKKLTQLERDLGLRPPPGKGSVN